MPTTTTDLFQDYKSDIREIALREMQINPVAQREYNSKHASDIASMFSWAAFSILTVNIRDDGTIVVVDGQHRRAAAIFREYGDQKVQCQTYEGLSVQQEAELFLELNRRLAIRTFDKYRISLAAGRDEEVQIDKIVRGKGLYVSTSRSEGSIRAVGTLKWVYRECGPGILGTTLEVIRDAYGDSGWEVIVIRGVAMVLQRYPKEIKPDYLVSRLASANGGVSGLRGKANVQQKQMRRNKSECVAAAIIEIVNSGQGGRKVADWWRTHR